VGVTSDGARRLGARSDPAELAWELSPLLRRAPLELRIVGFPQAAEALAAALSSAVSAYASQAERAAFASRLRRLTLLCSDAKGPVAVKGGARNMLSTGLRKLAGMLPALRELEVGAPLVPPGEPPGMLSGLAAATRLRLTHSTPAVLASVAGGLPGLRSLCVADSRKLRDLACLAEAQLQSLQVGAGPCLPVLVCPCQPISRCAELAPASAGPPARPPPPANARAPPSPRPGAGGRALQVDAGPGAAARPDAPRCPQQLPAHPPAAL
jgi:hypothetical protein